jgi:hypothetical protein
MTLLRHRRRRAHNQSGTSMTPKELVTVLDEWITKGGALPEGIPHDYVITTVDEANAVCRALSSGNIYAINSIRLRTPDIRLCQEV